MSTEWYEDRRNVADLIEWMFNTGRLEINSIGIDGAIRIVRYPAGFGYDWREMLAAQRDAARIVTVSRYMPRDGSPEEIKDELAELGWC